MRQKAIKAFNNPDRQSIDLANKLNQQRINNKG